MTVVDFMDANVPSFPYFQFHRVLFLLLIWLECRCVFLNVCYQILVQKQPAISIASDLLVPL